MMKQLIESLQQTWDEQIPKISFAYNTAPSDATGFSLAYLNHGRELSTPGNPSQAVGGRRTGAENRLKRMHEALELSQANMARSFTKQWFHYTLRRREWEPKIGELVLKELETLSNKAKHCNAALDKEADRPYRIRKETSPIIFDPEDYEGNVV
ncbi:hypothetical protein QAD02_021288 [Eretmocerus hayati]|uniref:Uncharacterized protein n=1 Tax=Eretmocerus hayati TaxID=131215 RepID=A0ACC2PPH6_9HYME|nr:hypothetical protein QAD02_021288 [Eretmocerus hayati]